VIKFSQLLLTSEKIDWKSIKKGINSLQLYIYCCIIAWKSKFELYYERFTNENLSVSETVAINAALWHHYMEIKIAWTRKKFRIV